jgi:ubiquitin-activating enzyme E1
VALAGVKSLTLADHRPCVRFDMGTQFYVAEADLGQNRAEVSAMRVSELNPYVQVKASTVDIESCPLEYFLDFDVVVLCDVPFARQVAINKFVRSQATPIRFLSADVRGIACWAFADFGTNFEVADLNGEDPITIAIASITNATQAVVSLQFNHHFHVGAPITFRDMAGMTGLNARVCNIVAVTEDTLTIDVDTTGMGAFGGYGDVVEIKTPVHINHRALEDELAAPTGLGPCDFVKMEAHQTLFAAIRALDQYRTLHGALPPVWDAAAAAEVLALAGPIFTAVFKV